MVDIRKIIIIFVVAILFYVLVFSVIEAVYPTPKYEDYSVIKHDPTADWKIYRNEEYGFEFKYSTKKYIAEELSKFSQVLNEKILVSLYDQVDKVEVEKLGGGEYSRFQVYVSDNKDKLSLIDFANINYKSHLYNLVKTKVTDPASINVEDALTYKYIFFDKNAVESMKHNSNATKQ